MKRVMLFLWLIPFLLFGQARNTITNDGTKNPYWYMGYDVTAKAAIGVDQNHKLYNTFTIRDQGSVGSETFVPGWLSGSGWKLNYQNNEYTLTIDNLDIRGTFSAREFLINQTNIGNGNWLISSGAKVDSVGPTPTTPYFIVENVTNHNIAPFVVGDIIMCQMVDPSGKVFNSSGDLTNNGYLIKRLVFRVIGVTGLKVSYATLTGAPTNVGIVEKGDTFVRIGNLTNTARQGMVGIYADEQYSPYIRITDSLDSWAATKDFSKIRVQLGRLYFTSPTFGAIDTYGLYAQGNIYLENGSIALSDSGYVKAGKTNYADATAGFFLGNDAGTPKFNIGNSTKYLKWTGTTLDIKGNVTLDNQSSISISGFSNDAGFITSADAGIKTTYSTTAPSTPGIGDFWYDTSITNKYIMKRWNGTIWQVTSVYADASGLYADNITAGQVTAGTFTGFTFQTAASGDRIVIGTAAAGTLLFLTDATPQLQIGFDAVGAVYQSRGVTAHYFNNAIFAGGNEVATQSWVNTNYDTFPGFGTTGTTACVGNDARLSDSRVASDVYAWAKAATKPSYTAAEVGAMSTSHAANAITSTQITVWDAKALLLDEAFWTTINGVNVLSKP